MMDRNKAMEKFYIEHLDLGLAALIELKQFCLNNRESLEAEIKRAFAKLIKRTSKAQQEGTKGAIFCINLCFLRSNFLMRDGKQRIYGYDQQFYFDSAAFWEDVDFTGLCDIIWKLEDALCLSLRQYKNKVRESDVQTLIQTEYIPHLVGQITMIAKSAVGDGDITKGIGKLSITDDFCILSGEYQGDFEEIMVTERLDTKGMELKEFLKIHKKDSSTFCSKRYQNQEVNNLDLRGINFTKSCFLEMDFSDSDFSTGILLSTEWRQCRLVHTCWRDAQLFGSSFINSDLSESDFTEIIAPVVPGNPYFPIMSNWDGVRFNGTILTHTKFSRADLRQADFRGATFDHTDFSEALLTGALFDKAAVEQAGLSEEQKSQIKTID